MAKVLSLFDGMACGMIAMQLAGVEVESYDAYEIDKYAIKTAQHNFPMIKEHGDVFDADFTQYEGVDFLIGGSPCTYWSIAQTKNRETVASGMGWELFSQYVRALREAKPKYFIYENNKSMSKAIRASIDETFGFEAVLINSALVSAQNRQRLYWVGKRNDDGTYSKVLVEQPEDRGILLRDILETGVCWRDKSYTLDANYHKTSGTYNPKKQHSYSRLMAAEPVEPRCVAQRGRYPENPKLRVAGLPTEQMFEAREDGKTNTLTTVQKDNLVAEPVKVGYVGNGGQGNRVYSVNGKAVAQTAQSGGMGSNTGLYAMPLDGFIPGERTVGSQMEFLGGINGRHEKWLEDGKNYSRNFSQGHRLYGVNGKAVTQTAQACGYAGNTGLYATPVRVGDMPSADGKICGSQSKRIYSIDGKAPSICATESGGNSDTSSPATRLYAEPLVTTKNGKSFAITANYVHIQDYPNDYAAHTIEKSVKPLVAEPVQVGAMPYSIAFDDDGRPIKAVNADGKEITIYEVRNGLITIKGKQYPIKLVDGYYIIRKLTVRECMRLQTVPEWYEFPVSDSQAYKMLGNGWTCEVIAHLIRSITEVFD